MNSEVQNPFPLILLFSAAAQLLLATIVARKAHAPGAKGMTTVLMLGSFWSVVDGCFHLLPGYEYLLTQLSYLPTVLGPVGFLVVALDYRSQLDRVTPKRLAVLLTIPALTVLAAFTNSAHHLVWLNFEFVRRNGLVYMDGMRYGAWFYVHIGYSYLMNMAASVMLLQSVLRSSVLYRRQVASVVLAIGLPWAANIIYMLRLGPAPGLDLTSAAFAGSCLMLTVGILFYQLFDVIPIAYDAAVQQMRDAVIILDADGRLLDCNPNAATDFGLSRYSVGRVPEITLMTAEGRKSISDLAALFAEEVLFTHGNVVRYLDVTVSPLRIHRDRTAGRIVVLRDVTARQLQTEALLRSQQEIAAANLQLSELNQELRSAFERVEALAKEAEAANRVKSEFLAAMSHEIRTPLNAVLATSDLLEDSGLTEDQREYTGLIRNAGSTLLSIINDILDLSKAEAGKMELEIRAFSLLTLVEQVTALVEEPVNRKGLLLRIDVEPGLESWVEGDGGRVRQVLLNFASNGVKFTEKGSVVVRVRRLPDGTTVRFEVEDTGIGIREEARSRLFEVFRQADASMKRRYGGTGLGLAICRRLVELMNGTLGFDSTFGRGSTFWFNIPLPPCAPPAGEVRRPLHKPVVIATEPFTRNLLLNHLSTLGFDASCVYETQMEAVANAPAGALLFVEAIDLPEPGTPEGKGPRTSVYVSICGKPGQTGQIRLKTPVRLSQLTTRLSTLLPEMSAATAEARPASKLFPGMRVLVAEDNSVNARLATIMLERWGVKVDLVRNGGEAVEAVRRGNYDIVFMDLQMPEMDGLEATRLIRAREQQAGLPRLPIIALTANVLPGERDGCREAGMDEFLPKPIGRGEFERVLSIWYEKSVSTTKQPEEVA